MTIRDLLDGWFASQNATKCQRHFVSLSRTCYCCSWLCPMIWHHLPGRRSSSGRRSNVITEIRDAILLFLIFLVVAHRSSSCETCMGAPDAHLCVPLRSDKLWCSKPFRRSYGLLENGCQYNLCRFQWRSLPHPQESSVSLQISKINENGKDVCGSTRSTNHCTIENCS